MDLQQIKDLEMSKIEELKKEADDLGIKYSPNIGEATLEKKINDKVETGDNDFIKKAVESPKKDSSKDTAKMSKEQRRKARAAENERKAKKTRVITIIDNDQRVNNQTTSCTVSCGNEYFDLGTIILPLGTPVEVMQGHINVLKEVEIPLHIRNPKNGLSDVQLRKRYTISYEEHQPD